MWAPALFSFPRCNTHPEMWHMVHPLDLVHSVCNPRKVVMNCNRVRDEPPEDVGVCQMCVAREHFGLALSDTNGDRQ